MGDRYQSRVAVFLILLRKSENGKEILLQKRYNTGHMDGYYDLAACGHLEENESIKDAIIRESKEELTIDINSEDLKLVTVYHEKWDGPAYLRFFFYAEKYEGIETIGEPDKCSQLLWSDINNLPENIIPHLKIEINNFKNNVFYGENGFR